MHDSQKTELLQDMTSRIQTEIRRVFLRTTIPDNSSNILFQTSLILDEAVSISAQHQKLSSFTIDQVQFTESQTQAV